MASVGATTLLRHFGKYQDIALREPVAITSNGRERLVLLSSDEYKRLKRMERDALAREHFTAGNWQGTAASQAPIESAQFNPEVK
jgi:prevent-host-death family protein